MAETLFKSLKTIKHIEVYNVVPSVLEEPHNLDQKFKREMVKLIYWAYGL